MPMFTLIVKDSFAAAHRLENYKGKCEELHGHNYAVEVLVAGEKLDKDGMLIDFKVLKADLKNVLDTLDHKYINDIPFFRERASSSEYVAMYIWDELKNVIAGRGLGLKQVRVWESENSCVIYEAQN